MTKTKYIIIILAVMGLTATPFLNINAQDTATGETEPLLDETAADTITETLEEGAQGIKAEEKAEEPEEPEEVFEDENIVAEDFEINEPRLLPTSPYYPIKNIWRGFRSIFTFDPIRKAELKLRFANGLLIEAKKVAETKDRPKIVTKTLERYEKEFSQISDLLKRAPEERREEVKQFADKIIDHSFKQQRLIDGIEKRIDPEYFEKINKVREDSIKHFAQTLTHIVPPEEISEKITNIIEQQRGSDFKNFKNLEILKALEEKVPEVARDAIRQAQDNAFKRLQEKMTEIDEEKRKRFKDYVESVGGNEVRHLEILSDFTAREIPDIIRKEMEIAKEKTFLRIEEKMKKFTRESQKQEFLKHLEGGEMEDLRIIKELENNLAPETIDKILEIKNTAMNNFRREFEAATTEENQNKFFKEIEKFHDVKQFEIFSEIEKIIPEDKKDFFETMKEKAMEEMEQDLALARDAKHRAEIFERLAGDAPEHFEILKEFAPPPEIMEGLLREQAQRMQNKFEFIQDPGQLQFFKRQLEDENFIREELERMAPDLFRRIEEKSEIMRSEIKKDDAVHKLEIAREELAHTTNYLSELKTNEAVIRHLNQTPVNVHLENAKKNINEAETALQNEKYGHVFGAANDALHELRNVGRMIKDSELRAEIAIDRIEEMEEMMELREEMMEEFEDIKQEFMEEEKEITKEIMERIMEEKTRAMEKLIHEERRIFDKDREYEIKLEKQKIRMMEEMIKQKIEPKEIKEIDLRIDEHRFSDEEIEKIKKLKQVLPLDVQRTLRNIPSDMMLETMERLHLKIQDLPSALVKPIPISIPGTDTLLCPPLPLRPLRSDWCKDGEIVPGGIDERGCPLLAKCIREEEVKPIACPLWTPPSPGWCEGGKIISGELDERGCRRPPKCMLPGETEGPTSDTIPVPTACPLIKAIDPEFCKRQGGKIIEPYIDDRGCKTPFRCLWPSGGVSPTEPIVSPDYPKPIPSIEPVFCIQVITPAKNPKTGECKNFPTPCDVPDHWEKVNICKDVPDYPIPPKEVFQIPTEERSTTDYPSPIKLEQLKIEEEFLRREKERLLELERQ